MTITVQTNLPEFKSKLNQISTDLQKRSVRQAVRAAGGVYQRLAKQYAPVRNPASRKYAPGTKQLLAPGTLKASIGVVSKRAERGVIKVMVIPKAGRFTRKGKGSQAQRDAYYWAWVEQGHVISPGRLKGGKRRKALERSRLKSAGRVTRPANYLKKAWQAGQGPALTAFYAQMEKAFVKYSAL